MYPHLKDVKRRDIYGDPSDDGMDFHFQSNGLVTFHREHGLLN